MRRSLAILISLIAVLQGKELEPWFGQPFQIQGGGTYTFEMFDTISTKSGGKCYDAKNHFLTGLATVPILGNWDVALEAHFSKTSYHSPRWDSLDLTGRYLVFDDVIGDPVSMTAGVTLGLASGGALRDLSTFYHGLYGIEAHIAVGKEVANYRDWIGRLWASSSIGIAERGSAWTGLNAGLSWKRYSHTIYSVTLDCLWGLGNHDLTVLKAFDGYASINHQSTDLGLSARFHIEETGTLTLAYKRRIHSKNAPQGNNIFMVEFLYPIPLDFFRYLL